ncbi:MAG: EMC3/TMCO1 family protein [Methanomicrobium sp.]|nr:EMC3/TMCO1 family protein [Methanomicrobium sp.]MDD4126142.1 EMC3/TMCO1 family protein [Methanomicrobium sp.]
MAAANKKPAGGGMFTFLIIMVLVMIVYSVPFLRTGIADAAGLILNPAFEILGVTWPIMILVLAAVTGCYSSLLQKYTIDYEKMQRVQKKMRDFQKEFREAQLSGDEKRVRKLNEKRDKMMQEQLEMSQEQFKPLGWIMIITIPIFLWLLEMAPAMDDIVFPFMGTMNLSDPTFLFLPAWILWYMLCSLTLSQVIRKTLDIGGL